MTPNLKGVLEGSSGLHGKYIPDFNDLEVMVRLLRESGYKIVLTQGVYDMFHVGHGRYLQEASQFGDILIVGVDSDELTRQMKGPTRPFDGFNERIELLSMLSFVKIITRRDVDQHMYDLIRLVKPDVLVMSKTTSSFTDKDKAILDEFCGRIEHLDPQAPPESISTSAKMQRLQREGAESLAKDLAVAVKEVVDRHLGLEQK